MVADVERAIAELNQINELIETINISISKCEKVAMNIHWKISPFGLSGKSGVSLDRPIIVKLNQILATSNYTLNTLNSIYTNLELHPKEVDELKKASL